MIDLISRQAAIDAVSYSIELCNKALDSITLGGRDRYAVEVERNSLLKLKDDIKLLPSAQPETHEERTETHACDCIERQAALDWLKNKWNGMVMSLFDGIKALPSAQPERKTGRWIFNQYDANPRIGNWHCSECRHITIMPHHVCNYCPYCGAKMEVEHESD